MKKKLLLIALTILFTSAQAATVEGSLKQEARAFLAEHGPRHWARKSESMDRFLDMLKDCNHRYAYPENGVTGTVLMIIFPSNNFAANFS